MRLVGLSIWLVLLLALAAPARVAPLWAAEKAEDESALYVEEGRAAMAQNDYPRAARLLDKAIAMNPRRIDAYILRAAVHAVQKEYSDGVAVLRRARLLAPDNPHVLTMLGTQLLFVGKSDEGVPLLDEVVKRWPDRYEAWAALGHHHERAGQWSLAVRAHEAYFRTRPTSLASEDWIHQLSLANAYLRSGDPEKARLLYQQVPAEKNALARLGLAWSTAAIDCEAAMPLLAVMADLAEKYPQVLLLQGRCAIVLGRKTEALTLAQRHHGRLPDDPQSWALLGEARMANDDVAGARAAFAEAEKRDPGNRVYAFRLARAERLAGDPASAARRLQQAGPPEGYQADWTIERAEALHAAGQPAEVVELLRAFVAQEPKHAEARVLLGMALLETGHAAEAVVELDQGLQLDGKQARARRPLVVALNVEGVAAFRAGDSARAETLLARAADVGEDVVSLRNLGGVRLLAGNAEAALAALNRAAVLPDVDAGIYQLLGRANQAAGKPKLALLALRRAVALAGPPDDARAVAVRIDLAAAALEAGEAAEAVAVLEPALDGLGPRAEPGVGRDDPALRARVLAAWSTASRAAATQWMRGGGFARAYGQLEQLEKRLPKDAAADVVAAVRCDLALAATGAGRRDDALKRLRVLERDKLVCPYAAPADKLAVAILIAWNEGSYPGRADTALKRLNGLRDGATGAARPLVKEAARSIALRAAADQFSHGAAAKAKAYLQLAAKWEDTPSAETLHDLAVIKLEEGDADGAIAALEPLGAQVPEAYVNLGLAWEKKGELLKGLDYFRKAVAAGAGFAPLKGWVAAREKLWGAAP